MENTRNIVIKIKEEVKNKWLTERHQGYVIARKIINAINKGYSVTLDFEGIDTNISYPFADAMIGVIIRTKGTDYLKGKIKWKNASEYTKATIQWIITISKAGFCKSKQDQLEIRQIEGELQ